MLNQADYEQAVETCLDDVYRLALSITGSAADAADLSQIVFIRLSQRRRPFESEAHLKNWLLKCAANESRSLLRSFWKRSVRPVEDWMEPKARQPDPREEQIRTLVDGLKRKDRILVHLYYWQGCTHKEIAQLLNMSESAVSTRLYRIRVQLKAKLEES